MAAKAEAYLRSTGIADECFIGAEAEFYLFDDVRYQVTPHNTFFSVDSPEAYWNTGRAEEGGNMGYKVPIKGGYFPRLPCRQVRGRARRDEPPPRGGRPHY